LGWARPADLPGEGSLDESALALGGTLARAGGSLRGALDAALSSPSRRGGGVDDDGGLVGTRRAPGGLGAIGARARPRGRARPWPGRVGRRGVRSTRRSPRRAGAGPSSTATACSWARAGRRRSWTSSSPATGRGTRLSTGPDVDWVLGHLDDIVSLTVRHTW